jgi:hypothetical protein
VDLEFPTDIPLRLLNNWGLDLTLEEHRDALWSQCETIKPRLVILDPLYLLFAGVNYNDAHQLAPYLKWLLSLRNEFNCAVQIVHHYKKLQQNGTVLRGGQRLMGNATLHGFLDCGLYTEQIEAEDVHGEKIRGMYYTRVEREFRAIEPQTGLEVGLKLGSPGALDMQAKINRWDLERVLASAIDKSPGITTTKLAELFGLDKRSVLTRCRGYGFDVKTSPRGRGLTHKVFPQQNGNG